MKSGFLKAVLGHDAVSLSVVWNYLSDSVTPHKTSICHTKSLTSSKL